MIDPTTFTLTDPTKLRTPSHDELLQDIRYGLLFDNGKARQRPAIEAGVEVLANMVLAHLTRCGYVIRKGMPIEGPSVSSRPDGYKARLKE